MLESWWICKKARWYGKIGMLKFRVMLRATYGLPTGSRAGGFYKLQP